MEINCNFQLIPWDPYFGNDVQYSCTNIEANTTEPFQKIERIVGVHMEGKSNADVKGIWFRETTLDNFPRDLHEKFPNLLYLSINYCGISKITRRDLKGLESLVGLEIRNCKLTSLPDDLLADLPNLRSIYFNNNKIEFASSKLLQRFAGRTDVGVILLGNTKINANYIPNDPKSLKSLNELMKMIDDQCKKPTEPIFSPDSFDKTVRELWISGRYSDLIIVAGTKEFKVHKSILGMRNSVWAEIIDDHKEASEINITYFTSNCIEALLLFIYTGDIKEADEDAMENFSIAYQFKVNEMKAAYEEILLNNVNEDNAFEIFMLAHQHSADELKKEAFRFVVSSLPTKISETLMEDPEKLKKVVDTYREYLKLSKD